MKSLVTGSAGFIGFHLVERLLQEGHEVVGIDNLNDYYDPALKMGRLQASGLLDLPDGEELPPMCTGPIDHWKSYATETGGYRFYRLDLSDRPSMQVLFARERFDRVYNMAAQAGVRYSLENPHAYTMSNIEGFLNVLEGCRHNGVQHLIYASSSSVYGMNEQMPFSVEHSVDHPVSLYAATKKSNELMAHTYSHLYGIATTGLRFFTVYGPWGRPDMAPILFTDAIEQNRPINVFNNGNMQRDFTYIDDIIEGVIRVGDHPPEAGGQPDNPSTSSAPFGVYNIGRGEPVRLLDFIEALEKSLGKKAEKSMMPMQPGDVESTWADVGPLQNKLGYQPVTSVTDGVQRFVQWYRDYYKQMS